MIVYILMLLISILFIFISTKADKKWKKIICYILAGLPFFLVSALRYDVGTDYLRRYNYDYNRISQGIDVKNLEIGFKLIIRFCLLFTQESYLLFIVISAITIGSIMYIIIKKSKNPILSLTIFLLAGFFFDSLNIVRQYLAISLVVLGYPFLLNNNKKILLFIPFVIVAGLMHSTAFIMLILLVLNQKMLANWKWVIPTAILILILNENLLNILGFFIQNTRFSVYLTGKFAQGDVSYLFIAENLLIYLFMYYIYSKNKKLNNVQKEDILFLNIQALALLVMVLGSCHMLFIRIALYFSIFQIISIPYYISKMPNEQIVEDISKITKDKINLKKIENKLPQYATAIIVLCFIFAFTRTNILTNTNEVLPYKTILNKEISIE